MPEFISVHISKTAGSAFRDILCQVLGEENVLLDYDPSFYSSYQFASPLPSHIRAIHGHFCAEKYANYFPEAKWIVWLRHPIFRLISEYFFAQVLEDPLNPLHVRLNQNKLDFLEFTHQEEARNLQFSSLQGKELSDFYFVGLQEFYLDDLAELKQKAGWADFAVNPVNTNPYPQYYQCIQELLSNPQVLQQVADWNREDMELYQEALILRARRRQETAAAQFFLSSLQQTKPLIQHLQDKAYHLENYLQKSDRAADFLEAVIGRDSHIAENLLAFCIDSPSNVQPAPEEELVIQGWAIGKHERAIAFRVWANNQVLSETPINLYRPDVVEFHSVSKAEQSGFQAKVFVAGIAAGSKLLLQVVLESQLTVDIGIIRFMISEEGHLTPKANYNDFLSNLEQAIEQKQDITKLESLLQDLPPSSQSEHLALQLKYQRLLRQHMPLQNQLNQTKRNFDAAQSELEQVRGKLEETHEEYKRLQQELEQTRTVLEEARSLEYELHRVQKQLNQKRNQIRSLRRALKTRGDEVLRAQDHINAMEASKFWQVRVRWFRFKKLLGLGAEEISSSQVTQNSPNSYKPDRRFNKPTP